MAWVIDTGSTKLTFPGGPTSSSAPDAKSSSYMGASGTATNAGSGECRNLGLNTGSQKSREPKIGTERPFVGSGPWGGASSFYGSVNFTI